MSVSDYMRGIDNKNTYDGGVPNPLHTCDRCIHSRPHEGGKCVWCLKYSCPCSKMGTCVSFQHG